MIALLPAAARMLPLALVMPLGPPSVRLIFGGVLALAVAGSMPAVSLSVAALAVEVVVGLTLGLVAAALFAAAEAAGALIDEGRRPPRPAATSTSPFRLVHKLLALALFAAASGPSLLVDAIGRSYAALPAGQPPTAGAEAVIAAVFALVVSAVAIAAPVLSALVVAEVAVGLVARAAPAIGRRLAPTGGARQLAGLFAAFTFAALTAASISDGMRGLGRDVLTAAHVLGGP